MNGERVLIICRGDGYINAFADAKVDVQIVIMPSVQSTEAEILAETLVREGLPPCFADLWCLGNLRATENVRVTTVGDLMKRQNDMELLAILNQIADRNSKPRRAG